ncbi:MAG: C10 family peptidase [Prevotella sp.]|nr:C10 family peptidase [Prevotella sp.]
MMRRCIFLSFLLAFSAVICNAQKVTLQQAEQKAMAFMKQRGVSVERGVISAPLTQIAVGESPIYVFNASEGEGYVIVSGDDRTEEILGYGLNSRFDEKKLSETMKEWLTEYATQIDDLRMGRMKVLPLKVSTHAAIGKLVSAQWDQGEASTTGDAYNQLCPTIQGNHCVTGCVATAMAQVMYYNKWPTNYCSLIPGYTSNKTVGYVNSLPKLKFDWSHMLDRYDEGQTTQECKAVAQLMQYCGSAVEMNYGTDASSAYFTNVALALRNYFDYDVNTRYVHRSDYSAEGWDNLIYKELSNGRPVVYTGRNPGGGHAFVCDGYDGNGFYHINWGWGGYCNGYFKLSILNPKGGGTGSSTSNSGYSVGQGAIVGIQKNNSTTGERRTLSLEDFTRDGHTITAKYANRTGYNGNFDYGFAYQDVSVGGNTYKLKKSTDSFEPLDIRYYDLDLDGVNLSDGTYNFYPYATLTGESWYHMLCDYTKYFEVKFSGGQVSKITYHPVGSLYINSVKCVSNRIVDQPQEIQIEIKNEGEEFTDKFYLFASTTNEKGEYIDEVCLPVESGGQEQTSLYFTPNTTGKWKVWLDIKEDGSSGISPWEFNIIKAPTSKSDLSVVYYEIISNTDAIFKARIKNNSSNAGYYMPINCYLFEEPKTYNIAFQKTRNLNIAAGEIADVEFRFESLEMGKTYEIALKNYAYHNSNGTEWLGNSYKFTINKEGDPADIDIITTDPTTPMDIYSLSGVLLREKANSLEDLPNGIYIINGKKVVVRK